MFPVFLAAAVAINNLNTMNSMNNLMNNDYYDKKKKDRKVDLRTLDKKELIKIIISQNEQFHMLVNDYISSDKELLKQTEDFNSFAREYLSEKLKHIKQSLKDLKTRNEPKFKEKEEYRQKLADLGFDTKEKMFNKLVCSIKLNMNCFEDSLKNLYKENPNLLVDYKTLSEKKIRTEKQLKRPFGKKLYGKKYNKVCEEFSEVEKIYNKVIELEKHNNIFNKNFDALKTNYTEYLNLIKKLNVVKEQTKDLELQTHTLENYLDNRYVTPQFISKFIKEIYLQLPKEEQDFYNSLSSQYSDKIFNSEKEELIDIINNLTYNFKRLNLNSPAVILTTENTLESLEKSLENETKKEKQVVEEKEDDISDYSENE